MFRRKRLQKGQLLETPTSFSLRYYVTTPEGERKKVCVKLADKGPDIRTLADIQPLIGMKLAEINGTEITVRWPVGDFVEKVYLPYVDQNMAAVTAYSYRRLWAKWRPYLQLVALDSLTTPTISDD